eukprot:Lankesteria_metandrocarpae@DN8141_c0_g1_i1.p1
MSSAQTLLQHKKRNSRMSMDVVNCALKDANAAPSSNLLSVEAHSDVAGENHIDTRGTPNRMLLPREVERRRNLSLDLVMLKEDNARRSTLSIADSSDAESRGGRQSRRRSSSKSLQQQDSEHLDFVLGKVGRLDNMAGAVVDEKKRTDQYVEDDGRRHAVAEKTIKYVDPVTGVRTSRRLYAHSSRIEFSQGALTKPTAEPTSVLEMLKDPTPVTETQAAPRPPTSPRPPSPSTKPPRKTSKASKGTDSPQKSPKSGVTPDKVKKPKVQKVDKQTETIAASVPPMVNASVQSDPVKSPRVLTKSTNTDIPVTVDQATAAAVEHKEDSTTSPRTSITNVYCCHHHCCCCSCNGNTKTTSSTNMVEILGVLMSQNAMMGPLVTACMNEERQTAHTSNGHHHHCCAVGNHHCNIHTATASTNNDCSPRSRHQQHTGGCTTCDHVTCPCAHHGTSSRPLQRHSGGTHLLIGDQHNHLGERLSSGARDSTTAEQTDFDTSGGARVNSLWQSGGDNSKKGNSNT